MTLKGEREGMEDVAALFTQRGEVGADGAEGLGTGDGTETPGGFLLELGHTDIAFGLVIVEGHPRVGKKAQDLVGVLTQTQEKIDRNRGLSNERDFYAHAIQANGRGLPQVG